MRPASHTSTTGRRSLQVLAVFGVATLVLLAASAGTAAAKGPVPVEPEPSGPLTAGETSEIVVALEWPGGEIPEGMNPEIIDLWGDDLPWQLVVVPGALSPRSTVPDGTPLPLSHDGELRYTASFTPATPGQWTLAVVGRDSAGTQQATAIRVVQVDEPRPETPTTAAVGGGAILVTALGLGALMLWFRNRRHPRSAAPQE